MAATAPTTETSTPSWLERSLGAFTEVRAGEGLTALLLAADIFCLLASYYLLKTARESLILSEGSAEVKSYAAAAQAMMLLVAIPLYGRVASHVRRGRLVNGVTLFFISHLAVFNVLASRGVHIGVAFFLWVGIFNLMIVAQFWALANDVYTVDRGRRLFPLVGVGGSVGAWWGARGASKLMTAGMQPTSLFMIAAAGLLACVCLNAAIARRTTRDTLGANAEKPLGADGGIRLICNDRYLLLIALLVTLGNLVNTSGEYLLGRLVVADALAAIANGTAGGFTKPQLIGIFYGNFFAWVNAASLAIQLLVVSRLFKRIGVAGALFVLPMIAMGSCGLFALAPVLSAVRVGKILENSTDYSLQNTARHALFLPTSREAKFKAKQVIDGLCWRLGDVLQAGVVFAGVRFALNVRQFALLTEVFVAAWLCVVIAIYREYKRRVRVAEPRPTSPHDQPRAAWRRRALVETTV